LELDEASQVEGDGRLEYPKEFLAECRKRDQRLQLNVGAQEQGQTEQAVSKGLELVRSDNGASAMDEENLSIAKAQRKKRRLELTEGAALGDASQLACGSGNAATALVKNKITVHEVSPSQQLEPGASLDDILSAMNAVAAKLDNQELSLKLVGGDVMECSKEVSSLAEKYNQLRREFDAQIGSSTSGIMASGYADVVRKQPVNVPLAPAPLALAPASDPNPPLSRPPLMDMERCKVKLECLNGGSFYGPTSTYLYSEMQRAGLPLPPGAPVYWPNDRFRLASVTFPHPSMADSYVRAASSFLASLPPHSRWFRVSLWLSSSERTEQVQNERSHQLLVSGAQQARGPVQEAANLMLRLQEGDATLKQFADLLSQRKES
jgi:hypothetical protein